MSASLSLQETMDFIYRAVANTPTSYNGQQFSVIDIDDPGPEGDSV